MSGKRYADLVKSSAAYKTLMKEASDGRLSHAYLLISPDKVALDLLTDLFLTEAVGESYARGVCEHTLADVIRLPEEGEKVLVRDINLLTETAYITPTELKRKFYVIDYGETMNEASQNKLLKTLEEPPSIATVVIKTASETKLLPTVLSRCHKIELAPFSAEAIKAELVKYYPDDDNMYIALNACRGQLSRAEKILSQPIYGKLFSLALDMLTNLDKSGGAAEYMFKMNDYRENLKDIIDFIQLLLIAGVRYESGIRENVPYDVARLSERYPMRVALKETEVLDRARRRLDLNGNPAAVIDELLFSFLEVRAKWK